MTQLNMMGHNGLFDSEFIQWCSAVDASYEAIITRVNIEREWGSDLVRLKLNLKERKELSEKYKEHLIWRCGLFIKVPDELWNQWIEAAKKRPDSLSFNTFREAADDYHKDCVRSGRRLAELECDNSVELYSADIATVRSLRGGLASAVITDPPYHLDTIELWRHLAEFSDAVLSDNGWLIAMSGTRHLPEVFTCLGALRYCWTISLSTQGKGNNVFLAPSIAVNTFWKPILVYCKGNPQAWPEGMSDILVSEKPMKNNHDWGQNVEVFEKLVRGFSPERGLVVDPFLGGGTTGEAAVMVGNRRFEGFDIDNEKVEISRGVINERMKGGLLVSA